MNTANAATSPNRPLPEGLVEDGAQDVSLGELLQVLKKRFFFVVAWSLGIGVVVLGIGFLMAPVYTARTSFIPPQPAQQGLAASALASLGPLAGLAGGGGSTRGSPDQYVGLMQSLTVSNRIIDRFKLMEAYKSELRVDAHKSLAANVRISFNKKDGFISIEVDDKSQQRAADIANQYVDELRQMTSTLAVTEAQQRRVFFENQLKQSRDRLIEAQTALQGSGFNPGALKAEPRAAADAYARLRAEVTAAEVRLQVLRSTLTDSAPEIKQQQAVLASLRANLGRAEQPTDLTNAPDYVGRYREFKYQETLFELYARQFELARVDESREGMLVQVIDRATPPERKSKPKRATNAIVATVFAFALLYLWVAVRHLVRRGQPASGA
jgi:uncharacterized protein involved in exopolysaccharide biosynthesis